MAASPSVLSTISNSTSPGKLLRVHSGLLCRSLRKMLNTVGTSIQTPDTALHKPPGGPGGADHNSVSSVAQPAFSAPHWSVI